jgi:hypothetical protein
MGCDANYERVQAERATDGVRVTDEWDLPVTFSGFHRMVLKVEDVG